MDWGIGRAGLVQSLEIICRAGRGRGGCGKGMNAGGGGGNKETHLARPWRKKRGVLQPSY